MTITLTQFNNAVTMVDQVAGVPIERPTEAKVRSKLKRRTSGVFDLSDLDTENPLGDILISFWQTVDRVVSLFNNQDVYFCEKEKRHYKKPKDIFRAMIRDKRDFVHSQILVEEALEVIKARVKAQKLRVN